MQALNRHALPARRPIGAVLLVALIGLLGGSRAILYDTLDPDCFWHLSVAAQLARDGIGPIVDDLSFASLKQPWTPYSWLAELGMKWLWDAFGWRSAIAAQSVMTAALIALVALSCRSPAPRRGESWGEGGKPEHPTARFTRVSPLTPALSPHGERESALPIILATVWAALWAMPYLSFRPVTLAIVLIAACSWLLLRDRRLDEQSRAVWLVVPLTALCANVHFFALLMIPIVACLLIGAASERWHARTGDLDVTRRVRRYGKLLGFVTIASLATPVLPGMLRAVVHYASRDPTLSAGFVAEFQPFYRGAFGAVLVGLLMLLVACVIANRARLRLGEQLWVILGIVLLLRLGRFAPIFAILCAPALAMTLPRWPSVALERFHIRAAIAGAIVLLVMRLFTSFPSSSVAMDHWLNRHGPGTPGYPTAAAAFVEQCVPPRSGRMLNEFTWGGYLAWRLGDRFDVFVDGRTQLYAPQFWRRMYGSESSGVDELIGGACADVAVLPRERSRLRAALARLGWISVYRDERAEVMVPPERVADVSEVMFRQ